MSFFASVMGRVHSACDAIFGGDAVLRPAAGGAYPCKAELFQPEPEFGLGEARTVSPDVLLRVTKATLPAGVAPRVGDVFEVATADWKVIAKPTTEDDDSLRWTVPVEKVRA